MNICVTCPDGHPVLLAADKLGQTMACPRCLRSFRAVLDVAPTLHAGKVRRPRDDEDDEDEEEEERPKKKKTPPKVAPAKRKARKDDDDDEEEDEDEAADEGEPEPEIEWTRRKLQLYRCSIGLMIMMAGFFVLTAMLVFLFLLMSWHVHVIGMANAGEKLVMPPPAAWASLIVFVVAPFSVLALTLIMVGLCFNFFVPARAEARGMVLCALIFGGLVFLLGVLVLLSGVITSDEGRAENMSRLLGGLAGLCFAVSIMSAMAYTSKLMVFLRLHLEASQPITNAGFFFLYFGAMFFAYAFNPVVSHYILSYACYAMVLAIGAAASIGGRAAFAQGMLFLRLRKVIMAFIRDD